MMYKLEVIAFNIESCLLIQKAGAHRIELCDNPGEGGTTPSYGFLKKARELVSLDLFPMIRPRGGDFHYSTEEYEIMKEDILQCKELGCDGVVFGLLNSNGTIDQARMAPLIELAYPMRVTCHRAFDRTRDGFEALETLIEMGCERILTSGLTPNVIEGAETLAKLVEAADNRIIIMPGSGIKSTNIKSIAQQTRTIEFHTSGRGLCNSSMNYINPNMREDLQIVNADETEIRNALSALETYYNFEPPF